MVLVYLFWKKYPAYRHLFIAWDLTWLILMVAIWGLCFAMPAIDLILEKPVQLLPTLLFSLCTIVFAVIIGYGVKFLWAPWSPWKNNIEE